MFEIAHHLSIADAHAHLLAVETTVKRAGGGPLPASLTFFMPVWTPGSYLVREYARHIESLTASADGRPAAHGKIRKNAWQVDTAGASSVTVKYRLYANDISVRTNHADATHAYWNGAATYLGLEEAPSAGARVVVHMPDDWQIATALAEETRNASTANPHAALQAAVSAGFPHAGRAFVAHTFDELCDAPFECAKLIERSFVAHGKTHRIAAWDNADARAVDWDKIAADSKTIVEAEAKLVAGDRPAEQALPYERYLFIWHVTPRGRGGLEHRDSTTLTVKPSSFQSRSGHLDILSLIAHEFFHLWNVKRIRPGGLFPYRYQQENYTRMLWWFEGATSYYDWRSVRLAKLCTAAEYLHHLAEEIARLMDTPGAGVHSLEEASFDAWIKAYRPDENSLNSTVSYYLKGEIVCALLDIELRHRTRGARCLDDVVRHLYWTYGAKDVPLPEGELAAIVHQIAGVSLDDCFTRWVEGVEPLDVEAVLAKVGLMLERSTRRDALPSSLGVRLRLDAGRTIVEAVPRGTAAHRAGIDPGDEIIAIADHRLPEGRLDLPLHGLSPGTTVPVLIARDARIRTLDVTLSPPVPTEAKLIPLPNAPDSARNLYEKWLEDPFPTPAKSPPAVK
ncbi:MAG TPA: PDZ domain-containing protein [Polyangiaceae bacterium]|nr:PDZ domain-containing protein [Polyangiaceae bacterium]